jgi:hypothetical protein
MTERRVASLGEITPQVLSQVFPQWRVFSRHARWWATREGVQKITGPQSLIRRALTAPDLAGLAEMLCLQEYLDELMPDDVAAVYQGVPLPVHGTAG